MQSNITEWTNPQSTEETSDPLSVNQILDVAEEGKHFNLETENRQVEIIVGEVRDMGKGIVRIIIGIPDEDSLIIDWNGRIKSRYGDTATFEYSPEDSDRQSDFRTETVVGFSRVKRP